MANTPDPVDDNDPERAAKWRKQAEEIRAIAATMRPGQARQHMVDLAAQWDRLADQAERTINARSSGLRQN